MFFPKVVPPPICVIRKIPRGYQTVSRCFEPKGPFSPISLISLNREDLPILKDFPFGEEIPKSLLKSLFHH